MTIQEIIEKVLNNELCGKLINKNSLGIYTIHKSDDPDYYMLIDDNTGSILYYNKDSEKLNNYIFANSTDFKMIVPEGCDYDIDKIYICFLKEYSKPKCWEDYCNKKRDYYSFSSLYKKSFVLRTYYNSKEALDTVPTFELSNAFVAYKQLMSLRHEWIDGWEPNWKDTKALKYNIVVVDGNSINVHETYAVMHPLSFPSRTMAFQFLECFKDLLEKAKGLF